MHFEGSYASPMVSTSTACFMINCALSGQPFQFIAADRFTVNCISSVDDAGTSLSISCVAVSGVIASLTCSYDNGFRTEDCGKN